MTEERADLKENFHGKNGVEEGWFGWGFYLEIRVEKGWFERKCPWHKFWAKMSFGWDQWFDWGIYFGLDLGMNIWYLRSWWVCWGSMISLATSSSRIIIWFCQVYGFFIVLLWYF